MVRKRIAFIRRSLGEAHWSFLIVGAVFCFGFVALCPPRWAVDEQTHAFRAEQTSEAAFAPLLRGDAKPCGGELPSTLYNYMQVRWTGGNQIRRKNFFLIATTLSSAPHMPSSLPWPFVKVKG